MFAPIPKSAHTCVRIATKPFRGLTTWLSRSALFQSKDTQLTDDRHRRIHEPRADGEVGNYEEEELEAEENEFGNVEEESPRQAEPRYVPSALSNVTSMPTGAVSMSMMGSHGPSMPMAAPSQLISAQQQMLQSQI